MSRAREKFIYMLRAKDGAGLIKIGCSTNPQSRVRPIELLIWSECEICACAPGDHKHETDLHNLLALSHSHCEWFHPTDEVLAVMNRINAGETPAQIIESATSFPMHRIKFGGRHRRKSMVGACAA